MSFKLGINSDYLMDVGSAERWFPLAAEAGFTHMMWGHHWNVPLSYGKAEMKAIASWFRKYGFGVRTVHAATDCEEKCLWSPIEYQREAGVEFALNRLELQCYLETDTPMVMHVPYISPKHVDPRETKIARLEIAIRSLDEIVPAFERAGKRIALENLHGDSGEFLTMLLNRYPAETVGICFDSGHNNIRYRNYPFFEENCSRIYAMHLHDNDGGGDWHCPPFLGENISYTAYDSWTMRYPEPEKDIDWTRVADIIRQSPCRDQLLFEVTMKTSPFRIHDVPDAEQPDSAVKAFLADAYARCSRFAEMVG